MPRSPAAGDGPTESADACCRLLDVAFLHVQLSDEDRDRLERLAGAAGGASKLTRRLLREEDERTGPLADYLRDHPGLDLGLLVGGGGTGDMPERGRVIAFVTKLLHTHLPDWSERQLEAATAYESGDVEPLVLFSATVRDVIEGAAHLARITRSRPWENERDETEHILRDRREHPEHWVPLAEAAETYRRLAKQSRTERRAFGRQMRSRGAGRPAGRRKSSDRGSGDDGDGEGSDSPRGAA